jgi:methyl coenzyme M reductase beta subunit
MQAMRLEHQKQQHDAGMQIQELQAKFALDMQAGALDMQKTKAEIEKIYAEIERIGAQAKAVAEKPKPAKEAA